MHINTLSRLLLAYLLFLVLMMAESFYSSAHAAMVIEICGSAASPCKEPELIGSPSWQGGSSVYCDPVDTNCQVKPNQITVNPKTPLATPAGWTDPVPPSIDPVPPSTTATGSPPATARALNTPCGGFNTSVDSLTVGDAKFCGDGTNGTGYMCTVNPPPSGWNLADMIGGTNACQSSGGTWRATRSVNCPGGYFDMATNACSSATCPSGYTYSGGTCNLSDPSVVQKPSDGTCTIKRVGNSFSGDPLDPDCSANPGVVVNSDTVTVSPKSGSSENAQYKFIPDGSGSITITTPNDDGTTSQRTVVFGPPNPSTGSVAITGTSQATFSGTGSQVGSTPIGELPSDYNRETTQQSILSKLQSGLSIDEAGTPTDGSLSGKLSEFDTASTNRITAMEGVGNVTNLGLGLSITWPVSSCVDPEFTIPHTGKVITIPMCAKRADIQLVLNYLTALLAAITIFSIGAGALAKQG